MSLITQYLKNIESAVQLNSEIDIATLLCLRKQKGRLEAIFKDNSINIASSVTSDLNVPSPWKELTIVFLSVCQSFFGCDFKVCIKLHTSLVTQVTSYVKKIKDKWMLGIIESVASDAYMLSLHIDRASREWRKFKCIMGSNITLEETANRLHTNCFSQLLLPNTDSTTKASALYVANVLVKMYLHMNNSDQYGNVVMKMCCILDEEQEVMERANVPQLVTFYYFAGKFHYADSDYQIASDYFTFSYSHCPPSCLNNKRKILRYLIITNLCLGHLPAKSLLEKAGALQLQPIIECVKNGNVSLFNETVKSNRILFIRWNCYFQMMKLKILVYRRLFKTVYMWYQHNTVGLPTIYFDISLRFCGESEGVKAENIMEALITEGFIKGYIAHNYGKVVFSKGSAFHRLPLKKLTSD